MILRFRYGNVNDEYEYQDNQLQVIDSYLDEDQIRQRFADTYIVPMIILATRELWNFGMQFR